MIVERAYTRRNEPILLASGKTSHHYVDCRQVLLDPGGRDLACELVSAMIQLFFSEVHAVAAVPLGGIPLATSVSDYLELPLILVRKEAKSHGTGNQVEMPAQAIRGGGAYINVVVIEDVITTGASYDKAAAALRSSYANINIRGGVALVDRSEPGLVTGDLRSIFTLDEIVEEYEARGRNGYP
jgi:orotate phosphoribosyltransferase